MDWSKLPDLTSVALLIAAFGSVARRNRNPISSLWFAGWGMIALHFAASLFSSLPGDWTQAISFLGLASLAWAGILFMWSSLPYHRDEPSSRWMLFSLLAGTTAYIATSFLTPDRPWLRTAAAALVGALPLAVTLVALSRFNHALRWLTTLLYGSLSLFLLALGNHMELGLNALLFTVYLDSSIHFWRAYRRATTGAFVTIAGFFAWAAVFIVAPLNDAVFPRIHIESEVWNLPKYLVAVGMMLLLLEDQIEHNLHLALHDELTGLPNRRLFRDRLMTALERARRAQSQAALLTIDLNDFKGINDTLGHHVGDLLLTTVGRVVSGRLRRSDTVARTGGDEFSIILEAPTDRNDALQVALSLLSAFNAPVDLDGHSLAVSASIGLAIFPDDASDPESLCVAADRNMYSEKHASRLLVRNCQAPAPDTVRENIDGSARTERP